MLSLPISAYKAFISIIYGAETQTYFLERRCEMLDVFIMCISFLEGTGKKAGSLGNKPVFLTVPIRCEVSGKHRAVKFILAEI